MLLFCYNLFYDTFIYGLEWVLNECYFGVREFQEQFSKYCAIIIHTAVGTSSLIVRTHVMHVRRLWQGNE